MGRWVKRIAIASLGLVVLMSGIGLGALGALFAAADVELPSAGMLRSVALAQDAQVLDRFGGALGSVSTDDAHRVMVSLGQIHPDLRDAIIASEDARFWEHEGVDPQGILRALSVALRSGGTELQGASTITQQLLKHFFLGDRPPVFRKAQELLLANRFERAHGKDDLLELYLNAIYLGHGYAGVETASRGYFGKPAGMVGLAEAALLAGMIRAPSETSPFCACDHAWQQQQHVLDRLAQEGLRDAATVAAARTAPVTFTLADDLMPVRVTASVMDVVVMTQDLPSGALVTTTIDRTLQQAAVDALAHTLAEYTVRRGEHRGPRAVLPDAERVRWTRELHALLATLRRWGIGLGTTFVYDLRAVTVDGSFRACRSGGSIVRRAVPNLVVSGIVLRAQDGRAILDLGEFRGTLDARAVAWTRQSLATVAPVGAIVDVTLPAYLPLTRGATIAVALTPRPLAEGAIVALDLHDLALRALVGGVDARRGDRNRAIAARRPIGSTVKPFVMGAGLAAKQITPTSTVHDAEVRYVSPWGGAVWTPANWYRGHVGALSVTDAIGRSVNLAAVDIALATGIPLVSAFVEELSPVARVPWEPAIALGAVERSPLELASAFAVIARGGVRGRVRIIADDPVTSDVAVLSATVAAALDTLLLQPIVHPQGTARRLQALGIPVHGKTGTTDGAHDAWFVGYTAEFLVAVWVGYDQPASLGGTEHLESGGSLAVPIAEAVFRVAYPVGSAPDGRSVARAMSPARWGVGTSWVTRRTFSAATEEVAR